MRSRFPSGHDGRFTTDEARQHAWELMAFGPRPSVPPRRPHRGLLPDRAGPASAASRKPSALRRLARALRNAVQVAAGREAAAILSGTLRAPVGKAAPASYIGSDDMDETRHVPLV